MAENSSRLNDALESQESTKVRCSPENENSAIESTEIIDSFHDSESFASSVMGSQPIVPELRTPISLIPGGRNRHLSLPTVNGTDITKIGSKVI